MTPSSSVGVSENSPHEAAVIAAATAAQIRAAECLIFLKNINRPLVVQREMEQCEYTPRGGILQAEKEKNRQKKPPRVCFRRDQALYYGTVNTESEQP